MYSGNEREGPEAAIVGLLADIVFELSGIFRISGISEISGISGITISIDGPFETFAA